MTPLALAFRLLVGHWRLGVLAATCVAISTSVIVGALTVGTSVRGSLTRRLVVPLGRATHALAWPRVTSPKLGKPGVSAVLRFEGGASNRDEASVGSVTVWGVDRRFAELVPGGFGVVEGGQAWVTPALARDLGLRPGDALFLSVPKTKVAPPQSIFGKRKPSDNTIEVASTVAGVLPESGIARFSLDPSFRPLRSAFLDRTWLARQLGNEDAANVFLGTRPDLANPPSLADQGLRLVPARQAGGWVLQSDQLVLQRDQVMAAHAAAKKLGVASASISIALAKTLTAGSRTVAYAVVAWVEGVAPALNAWAAQDLAARPGRSVSADLLVAHQDGGFGTARVASLVGPELPLNGLGAEPSFVPQLEGVTDADRLDRWDAPFPIDKGRITERDELYWQQHRAAPRLFLPRDQIERAWEGKEIVTSVWFKGGTEEALGAALTESLSAGGSGGRAIALKANATRAARGSTDMEALVLALGAFVIVGALGLAATVFALAVRQQAPVHALLTATGVSRRLVCATAWIQGGLLAVVGAALGVPGGVAFASLSLGAMRRLMPSELGFDAMGLEVEASSLATGAALALGVSVIALAWSTRRVGHVPIVSTLHGGEDPLLSRQGRWSAVLWFLLAIGCLSGLRLEGPGRGLLIGALVFSLAVGALALGLTGAIRPGHHLNRATFLVRQVWDTASSFLMGVALSGLATFVLASVARHAKATIPEDPRWLVATSVPVKIDFGSDEGRRRLGFTEAELVASQGLTVAPFLRSPGDDVSCLNPARPVNVRTLGVPPLTARLRPYASQPAEAWETLLSSVAPHEAVPALADADTLAWTFESGVGKVIPWAGDREVRFVGALKDSALSREVLVAESAFREAFPTVLSPSSFIIEPRRGSEQSVVRALLRTLAPLGPEVRSVRDEIAAVRGVQSAYMAIFLALGTFGLVLGVVGAAFIALREACARRGRYALLRAVGLSRGEVAFFAVAPGLLSSLLGVVVGSVASLAGSPQDFALGPVALVVGLTLGVLFLVNLAISWDWRRSDLVEALRSE